MSRRTPAALVAAAALGAVAGCAPADPAAVAAFGLDDTGYLGVVMLCDEGRSLTHVEVLDVERDQPAIAWIGRTVEPITIFRLSEAPPDNWVVDVEGGLLSGTTYRFRASADDLEVPGPELDLDDLATVGVGGVVDPDGVVLPLEEFLDTGCD